MTRFLTGIQSSGRPHLGNVLGAIMPTVHLSQQPDNDCFLFIADLHSLTSLHHAQERTKHVNAITAAWLACGLDPEKNTLYRQSRIPEVCELMWYLSCLTPYPMLANAHSFKDKINDLSTVNAGLFTYPVLMAADIVLYDAQYVPVGKDQKQHIEIARDIASSFNASFGKTFVIPDSIIDNNLITVPGIDGRKMSKSYGNTIDLFIDDKTLKKQVFSIVTDSTPLEDAKDPDQDPIFCLYKMIADTNQLEAMRKKYLAGNYGYGHAKQELYECLIEKFDSKRKAFNTYMQNPDRLEEILLQGEKKARKIAHYVLKRVRRKIGYD